MDSGLAWESSCTRTMVIRLALVDGMAVVVPTDEAGVEWPPDPVAPPPVARFGTMDVAKRLE